MAAVPPCRPACPEYAPTLSRRAGLGPHDHRPRRTTTPLATWLYPRHVQTFGWLVGEVICRITGRNSRHLLCRRDRQSPAPRRLHRPAPPTGTGSTGSSNPQPLTTPDFTELRRANALTTPRIDPNDPRVHAAESPPPAASPQPVSSPASTTPSLTRSRATPARSCHPHHRHPPVRCPRPDPRRAHLRRPQLRPVLQHVHPLRGWLLRPRRLTRLRPSTHRHQHRLRHEPDARQPHHGPPLHQPRRRHHHIPLTRHCWVRQNRQR